MNVKALPTQNGPIGDNAILKVGDKVKVRIEIRVDRDMDYVHMKDMRASCMEPLMYLAQPNIREDFGILKIPATLQPTSFQ